MGKLNFFVFISAILFLTVIDDIPSCFASGVDAANAGIKAKGNGDKEKAKVLFRSALRSNELSKKNYIIVNNNLCGILWSEFKIYQAIECYTETLYLSGNNPWALRSRGVLYNTIGKHEKAIEDLSRYILLSPKDDFGYIHRALSLSAIKKFDKSISDLNKAIKLKPNKSKGYLQRGNTYSKTGNYNLALADFEKAIAVDPKSSSVYQAMAWFHATCPERNFRDGTAALKFAEKSLVVEKKDKFNPMLYDTLAAAYAELGQFKNAIIAQKQAIALLKKEENHVDEPEYEIRNRLDLYKKGKVYRAM
jgi:tetratricopeptide (TPR) repeat protein